MIYCCMELHLSGVFVCVCILSLLHETLYTHQFPKKLEKPTLHCFLVQKQQFETLPEGLVEPEVVERCRDNYNIELDQQLQEAIRSRLSLANFQGLKAYPQKRQKVLTPKKPPKKGDFFGGQSSK